MPKRVADATVRGPIQDGGVSLCYMLAGRSTREGTASLEKALDVLDAVGNSSRGLSQAELGQRLGPPRTTRVVVLPVPSPTGVALGGEGGNTLFVTTARDALDRESLHASPLSGRLFVVPGC